MSDLGIVFINSPLSATRSFIKNHRDIVLKMLRAYCEGIQQARSDKESAIKILARNARVEDPEILQELYRIYGSRHLERLPYVKTEGLEEILSTMGKEGANAKAADFVDNSLLRELERGRIVSQALSGTEPVGSCLWPITRTSRHTYKLWIVTGLLYRIKRPINKDTEMHPLVRWQFRGLGEDQRRAFYFEQVYDAKGKRYDMPVLIGGLAAHREFMRWVSTAERTKWKRSGPRRWKIP